jgi:BASS family bile acid:Na+ symporter
MLEGVLAPLGVGFAIRHMAPRFASRAAKPVNAVGMFSLAIGLILILIAAWPEMQSLLSGRTLLAILIVTALGLFVGHELGGPVDANRPVLALASVTRHPAVAIAVASAAFPSSTLVAPAVLLQFIVAALASVPYIRRSKRLGARPSHVAATERRSPATGPARGSSGGLAPPTRNGRSH